jgi:Spy/CpxP family protein refolding chaperone
MTRLGWNGWVAALALLAIGAAAGIAVDRLHHRGNGPLGSLHAQVQRDPLGVLDRELDLRPEQRARVAAILERQQGAMDAVWHDAHSRLRTTIDSMVSEIAAELDSSQIQRFRSLVDEVHGSPGVPPRPVHR